jgi:hypothetical protein
MVDDHGQYPVPRNIQSLKVCGLSVRAGKKLRTYKTRPRYSCKLVKDQPSILLGSTSRSHGEGAGSASDLSLSAGGSVNCSGIGKQRKIS